MSDTLTIATEQLEEFIQKSDTFKDAKIFQREEEPQDEGGDLVVYIWADVVQSEHLPYTMDFRKYPVNIVIKYRAEGLARLSTEDGKDYPRLVRNRLTNDMQDLMKSFNDGTSSPVYIIHQASCNMKYQAPEEIRKSDTKDVKRIMFVWDVHTIERYVNDTEANR